MVFSQEGYDDVIVYGKKVTIHYTLTVEGQMIDSSQGKGPLEYVQGEGQLIKGLENSLLGLRVNDEKNIVVHPNDAYGMASAEKVIKLPRNVFFQGVDIRPGLQVQVIARGGRPNIGAVENADSRFVTVNFNHPLAGKTLTFKVKIMSVE
jgi:FKBP-type peptidyl-prolyl cis-trans isomerase SlyD